MTELDRALKRTKSQAAGSDRITYALLTHLSVLNKTRLLRLYNLLFASGYVPESWKCALVLPILKGGKPPNETDSYRPISLTSCIGKCMEKIINLRIKWYLDAKQLLPKNQAGFRV